MCFQNFVHFDCGHTKLHEVPCDDAQSLDVPFLMLAACPNYSIQSTRENCQCGIGKFYCVNEVGGCLLDIVHKKLAEAELEEADLNSRLEALRSEQQEVLRFVQSISPNVTVFNSHPAIARIWDAVQPLLAARSHSSLRKNHAQQIIALSQLHRVRLSEGASRVLGSLPYSSNPRSTLAPDSLGTLGHVPTENAVRSHATPKGARYQDRKSDDLSSPSVPYLRSQEYVLASPFSRADTGAFDLTTESMQQRKATSNARPGSRSGDTSQRRRTDLPSAIETPVNVRRSARVSAKHVNYAESTSSEETLRETSLERSQSFSPPKSRESASPDFMQKSTDRAQPRRSQIIRKNYHAQSEILISRTDAMSSLPDNRSVPISYNTSLLLASGTSPLQTLVTDHNSRTYGWPIEASRQPHTFMGYQNPTEIPNAGIDTSQLSEFPQNDQIPVYDPWLQGANPTFPSTPTR